MKVRSNLIIHWTGKKQVEGIRSSNARSKEYVNLLKSIYLEGLRYNKIQNNEIVVGANTTAKIPQVPRICFTELKLTNARKHIEHYGPMGIGFRRDWLMKCGANPVFYMQNRNEGVVNTNLSIVSSWVDEICGLNVFLSFIKPMSEQNKKGIDSLR